MMNLKIDPELTLYVTGRQGDVTLRWAKDKPLPVGEWIEVASLQDTGGKNWGWVYLGSEPGRFEYQIYHETQSFGSDYAFFGWYDPNSTEANSDPSPFPSGVATADAVKRGPANYVLLAKP